MPAFAGVASMAVLTGFTATAPVVVASSWTGAELLKGSRSVEDVNHVRVEGAVIVMIDIGGGRGMRIDDTAFVQTMVSGSTLIVAPEAGSTTRSRIRLTLPALKDLSVSNGGQATVQDLSEAGEVAFSISNDGQIEASGTAGRVEIVVKGPGRANLAGLAARSASAKVDGSGHVRVFASDALSASVTGDGIIEYRGDPVNLAQAVSGSGAITRF